MDGGVGFMLAGNGGRGSCWCQLIRLAVPVPPPPLQTGYLSMDQARNLVPLLATDSSVSGRSLRAWWGPAQCSCHPPSSPGRRDQLANTPGVPRALQVYSTPLVGVWVRGPASLLHPLVACACLKFFYSSVLLDRVVQPDGSFMLLLCPPGRLQHPQVAPPSTCLCTAGLACRRFMARPCPAMCRWHAALL
jgi:hypothetical protein